MSMQSTAIKVGNRTFSIALLNDVDFDQILFCHGVNDKDIKSFVDYDDQIIIVRNKLQADHRQELILHELIHVCLGDVGISETEQMEQYTSILAPRLSCLLSSGLFDVLEELT